MYISTTLVGHSMKMITNPKILNGSCSMISPIVVFFKPCSSLHPGLLILVIALVWDDSDVGWSRTRDGSGWSRGQEAAVARRQLCWAPHVCPGLDERRIALLLLLDGHTSLQRLGRQWRIGDTSHRTQRRAVMGGELARSWILCSDWLIPDSGWDWRQCWLRGSFIFHIKLHWQCVGRQELVRGEASLIPGWAGEWWLTARRSVHQPVVKTGSSGLGDDVDGHRVLRAEATCPSITQLQADISLGAGNTHIIEVHRARVGMTGASKKYFIAKLTAIIEMTKG